jgi:hypothetical protein
LLALATAACSTGPEVAIDLQVLWSERNPLDDMVGRLRFVATDERVGQSVFPSTADEISFSMSHPVDFSVKAPIVDEVRLELDALTKDASPKIYSLGRSELIHIPQAGRYQVPIYVALPNHMTVSRARPLERVGASATKLTDGRLLVAGGAMMRGTGPGALATATVSSLVELYDPKGEASNPAAGTPLATVDGARPRALHAAVRLTDGRVALIGGIDATGAPRADVQLFDPALGTFSDGAALPVGRYGHAAALITNGPNKDRVVLVGGKDATGQLLEPRIVDPAGGNVYDAVKEGAFPRRAFATATPLENSLGEVLFYGGEEAATGTHVSGALYSPTNDQDPFLVLGANQPSRVGHTATRLGENVLIFGGRLGGQVVAQPEIVLSLGQSGQPEVHTVDLSGGTAAQVRTGHVALVLEGRVVIVGGEGATGAQVLEVQMLEPGSDPTKATMKTLEVQQAGAGRVLAVSAQLDDNSGVVLTGELGTVSASALRIVSCFDQTVGCQPL